MIRIEIAEGTDGGDVTIHGVGFPEPPEDAGDDFYKKWDERWGALCNGVHAFLAELDDPVPDGGWDVTVTLGSQNNGRVAQE